jgi:hypothetical protein
MGVANKWHRTVAWAVQPSCVSDRVRTQAHKAEKAAKDAQKPPKGIYFTAGQVRVARADRTWMLFLFLRW